MLNNKISHRFNFLPLLMLFTTAIASADDVADVEAVVHRYINSETLDLSEQTKLMASDRTFIEMWAWGMCW